MQTNDLSPVRALEKKGHYEGKREITLVHLYNASVADWILRVLQGIRHVLLPRICLQPEKFLLVLNFHSEASIGLSVTI